MDNDIKKPAPEGYTSPLTGQTTGSTVDAFGNPETQSGAPRMSRILESIAHPRNIVDTSFANEKRAVRIDVREKEEVFEDEDEESLPLLGGSSRTQTPKSILQNIMLYFGRENQANGIQTTMQTRSGVKRIILPVRIEPKVFFANERTFLSWLHCKTHFYSLFNPSF